MGFIYFLILIVMILIVLSFLVELKVILEFNSEKQVLKTKFFWLRSLIKASATREAQGLEIKVYLFNRKILNKTLISGENKRGGMELIRISNPKDIHVNVQYGFGNPYNTGIACGALNIASQLINIDTFEQTPDFMASNDYIHLDATAKVNIGSALINLIKPKK